MASPSRNIPSPSIKPSLIPSSRTKGINSRQMHKKRGQNKHAKLLTAHQKIEKVRRQLTALIFKPFSLRTLFFKSKQPPIISIRTLLMTKCPLLVSQLTLQLLIKLNIFLLESQVGAIYFPNLWTRSSNKIENKNNFSKRFRIVNNSWNNIYNERTSDILSLSNFKCQSNQTTTLSTNTTRYQISP